MQQDRGIQVATGNRCDVRVEQGRAGVPEEQDTGLGSRRGRHGGGEQAAGNGETRYHGREGGHGHLRGPRLPATRAHSQALCRCQQSLMLGFQS